MLLSQNDVVRLSRKGFRKDFFAICDKNGYLTLKNVNGFCVFYNVKDRRCRVYSDRPLGCRVYPVILDEEKGVVFDKICPSTDTINQNEKGLKGKKVVKLLEAIDIEAAERSAKSVN